MKSRCAYVTGDGRCILDVVANGHCEYHQNQIAPSVTIHPNYNAHLSAKLEDPEIWDETIRLWRYIAGATWAGMQGLLPELNSGLHSRADGGEASTMATVQDVATFILRALGPMTSVKLQKLVYYSQAWNLAWSGAPLFEEEHEAWVKGPVCRALFKGHRGFRTVKTHRAPEYRENLTDEACAVIYAVLEKYGHYEGDALVEMSHREEPWITARGGLGPTEPSSEIIPREMIAHYFVTLSSERPDEAPTRPDADAMRRAKFRRSKENVFRTHSELFQQLA